MSARHTVVWLTSDSGQDTNECWSGDGVSLKRTEWRLLKRSLERVSRHIEVHKGAEK